MFSVNMIRGLRAVIVSRSFSNIIHTATQYGGSSGVSRFKVVSGNHLSLNAVRRSFLNQKCKVFRSYISSSFFFYLEIQELADNTVLNMFVFR